MNIWISERDGRAHVHTLADSKGRYIVQKTKDGYSVDYLYASAKIWEQAMRLSTQPTLAAGKKWVEEHVEAAEAVGKLTLAEIKAKFDDNTEPFDGSKFPSPSLDAQSVGRCMRVLPAESSPLFKPHQVVDIDSGRKATYEVIGMDNAPTGDISTRFPRRVVSFAYPLLDRARVALEKRKVATESQGTMSHDEAMLFSRCLGGDEVCYTNKATGRLAWARWTQHPRKAK
jgi:hypothetical protein